MKPKKSPNQDPQSSLFQVELTQIIDSRHPLVKLAEKIDWERFERELGAHFSPTTGAPAKPVRLMVGLHYLKHAYNLSDEKTVERWVENPYWQHFCGMKHFTYEMPIDPSSMTRWRKLVGDGGMEKLLAETVAVGFRTRAITERSLANVNVDTTVQEKAISYPSDGKLYYGMIGKLIRLAKRFRIPWRQSYARVSKQALAQSGRYFHARQHRRAMREVRRLKTWLGRVIRDLGRKIEGDAGLEKEFAEALALATRLYNQKKGDKNKIYSLHAPEVECIGKGKAHKKFEFGNKASFVSTSREGFLVGALGLHGNPYDGHTLAQALEQSGRLCGGRKLGRAFVDRGYRGHGYSGPVEVHVCDHRKRPAGLRRWMRRRSAVEPIIGHMKNDGRLGRNYLLGREGDRINAILCAVGQNLRLLLRFFAAFFASFVFPPLRFLASPAFLRPLQAWRTGKSMPAYGYRVA
jgi:IS5 family transposase